MDSMCNINVGRYPIPTQDERDAVGPNVGFPADRYQGWIVPDNDDRQWAGFVRTDGTLEVVLL
jgi:hypothetical protein